MEVFKKVKVKIAEDEAVWEYISENVSKDEIIELLNDPRVIQINITKMTTRQYLKSCGN